MSKNVNRKWRPLPGIPDYVCLKSLRCDYDGLTIIVDCFNDGSKMLEIFFDYYLSYRVIDEGDLLILDEEDLNVQRLPENEKFPEVGTLRIVDRSSYVEWFYFVSQGLHEDEDVIHYGIHTSDDCVDILSPCPPIVKGLE